MLLRGSCSRRCTGLEILHKTVVHKNQCAVAANKVAYNDLWVRFITQQCNTAMKTAAESKEISGSQISKDLIIVKSSVGTVKHASPNEEMRGSFSLIQEVQTRFGTTFDVVCRFIKSAYLLAQLVASNSNDSSKTLSMTCYSWWQTKIVMTMTGILRLMGFQRASPLCNKHILCLIIPQIQPWTTSFPS